MVLSGDDLTTLPPARAAMLQETAAADRRRRRVRGRDAARWERVTLPGARMLCLFNWDDAPRVAGRFASGAAPGHRLLDRRDAAAARRVRSTIAMAPRSARLLEVS